MRQQQRLACALGQRCQPTCGIFRPLGMTRIIVAFQSVLFNAPPQRCASTSQLYIESRGPFHEGLAIELDGTHDLIEII